MGYCDGRYEAGANGWAPLQVGHFPFFHPTVIITVVFEEGGDETITANEMRLAYRFSKSIPDVAIYGFIVKVPRSEPPQYFFNI